MNQQPPKGIAPLLKNGPSVKTSRNILFVWVILSVMLSYSLDFECFLECENFTQSLCQVATDDLCAEPTIGSGAPPMVLPSLFSYQVDLVEIDSCVEFSVVKYPPPKSLAVILPVGLRAPPDQQA